MPPAPKTYGGKTVREHAADLGEKPETVRRWLAQGMSPEEPARADWVAQHRKRRHKRPKGELAGGDAPDDLVVAKHAAELRYKQRKADLLDLQYHERSGALIPVEEAERLQARLAAIVKQTFLEMPVAVADRIDPDNPEWVLELLEAEVKERLARLSKTPEPK